MASHENKVNEITVTNDASFQGLDDMSKHADASNDTLFKMNCEYHFLWHQLCKKILLSIRVGAMKEDEVLQHEKYETHAKCLLTQMRRLILPKNKYLYNEVVRRSYCASGIVKKSRVRQ